jgi:hypothetical protein
MVKTAWILMVMLAAPGNSLTMHTQEFDSEPACEAAKDWAMSVAPSQVLAASCYKKG